jgi:sphingomyelin synthase-related protein 1
MRLLHTVSWISCFLAMFFIMASREHYSIDVFLAFFITSMLFLYYHSMADSGAAAARSSERPIPCLWIPLFGFFESSIDGAVPNEYEWPLNGLIAGVQRGFSSLYSSARQRSSLPFSNI